MKKNVVVGTATYALVATLLGVAAAASVDIAGLPDIISTAATFFVVYPVALLIGQRVGRVSHLSLLFATLILVALISSFLVFSSDWVARPAGGSVGFADLVRVMGTWNLLKETAVFIIVPQIWLWLLNRLAANNSFKPTPLRGAA